jgi:tetratricopeptide (TPR) repeat protein
MTLGCAPAGGPITTTPASSALPSASAADSTPPASAPTGSIAPAESTAPSRSATAPASSGTSLPSAVTSPGDTGTTAADAEIARYLAAVRADAQDGRSRVLLGYAYLQRVRETGDPADYGRAEIVLDEALALDPEDVDALIGKGTLALARHDFREALELGERARALAPTQPRAYGVIADAQTELGLYDEAVTALQTMVDLRPDLTSYSRISYARELRGQVDAAIKAMEQAVRAGGAVPENTEYVRVLLGNLHLNKGDLAAAERIYGESLAALPGFVYALAGLASVRAAQDRLDEAEKLAQQAVDAIPLPQFVIALAEIQEAAGRTREAETNYALVRQIQALFAENGVKTDLELALFEANHGTDPAAAVELARAAYADQPNIKAADALAWALYGAGSYDEAERYATEALRLGTRDASMYFHAGMIAKARGDTETARTRLAEAMAIHPGFSPLASRVARAALDELT